MRVLTVALLLLIPVAYGLSQTHYYGFARADTSNNTRSPTSWKTIGGLECDLYAGDIYNFKAWIFYASAAATTGIGLRANYSGSVTSYAAYGRAHLAADGNASVYWGAMTTPADSMVSTGVVSQNTTYVAFVEGIIIPSTNGVLQVQFESEVGGTAVTIKRGSGLEVWRRN